MTDTAPDGERDGVAAARAALAALDANEPYAVTRAIRSLRALIAEHERLTAPPADGERDALIAAADALVESWDRRGSWSPDSPVGMVMQLADALRRQGPVTVTSDALIEKVQRWIHENYRVGSGYEIGTDERFVDADDLTEFTAALSPDGNTEGNDR